MQLRNEQHHDNSPRILKLARPLRHAAVEPVVSGGQHPVPARFRRSFGGGCLVLHCGVPVYVGDYATADPHSNPWSRKTAVTAMESSTVNPTRNRRLRNTAIN